MFIEFLMYANLQLWIRNAFELVITLQLYVYSHEADNRSSVH